VPQIGAPAVWASGFTGKGVRVAVVDTGIDATHPDLQGQVVAAKDFSGEGPGDLAGHGTHVAATIAGKGVVTNGRGRGVAPDAQLVDAKACDLHDCDDSNVIAAMEWAAVEQHAQVINLSLGDDDEPGLDPLELAVNDLTERTGVLIVVAAGNQSPDSPRNVSTPASADSALAVGAVDSHDALAGFSRQGPRIGDGALKPELTAPGVDIVAARATGTEPDGNGQLVSMSGTSMAAPHAAGSAALLAQQHPGWRARDLRSALMSSAKWNPETPVLGQGAGRVDVRAASQRQVIAEPGSLSFGVAQWPHADDKPVSKQLTYRNLSAADVTLQLSTEFTTGDSVQAPAGALTLSARSVRVPAKGQASVTVASDTAHDGPDGTYAGRVIARSADGELGTPVTAGKEVESYDLTVRQLDRTGVPSTEGGSEIEGVDREFEAWVPASVGRIRLPKGEYVVSSEQYFEHPDGYYRMFDPDLLVDKEKTVTVDPRAARPLNVKMTDSTVRSYSATYGVQRTGYRGDPSREAFFGLYTSDLDGNFMGAIGDGAAGPGVVSLVNTQWARPNGEDGFSDSPVTYDTLDVIRGRVIAGIDRQVRPDQLARVTATYQDQGGVTPNHVLLIGSSPQGVRGTHVSYVYNKLPRTVTHFVEGGSVSWQTLFQQGERATDGTFQETRRYRAGHSYSARWGAVVLAPGFGRRDDLARRVGADLSVDIPLLTSADGQLGESPAQSESTQLFRGGNLIAESDRAGLLGAKNIGTGRFTVKTTLVRPALTPLSGRIEAQWGFKSEPGNVTLPWWTVRFRPEVDGTNTAVRRPVSRVPFELQAQPGSKPGDPALPLVEISGDGSTWKKAMVRSSRRGYVAVFPTPAGQYVSLRTSVADSAGNTHSQSITNAYALRS
jgi:hypothetical protein